MIKTALENTITLLKDRRFTHKQTMLIVSVFTICMCVAYVAEHKLWFTPLKMKSVK